MEHHDKKNIYKAMKCKEKPRRKNKTNLQPEIKYTSNSWLNFTDENYHICMIWPWGSICKFAGYFVTI